MRELKIGRLPSNDIVLNEPTVSKYHAILRIDQAGVTLTDLNSTNGTFVNGNRVEDSIQLNELDIVKLGLVLFDWNDYVGSNLEQKKANYQSYSEPDDEPQQEIEEEKNEPIVVQQSVYNSPSTNITQKSTNYTPLIIFVVILGFLGLAGLIIVIFENTSGSNYEEPYSVTSDSSEKDNKFTKNDLIGKWTMYEDYDTHGKTRNEGSVVFRNDGTYLGIDNGEIDGGGKFSFDEELMILSVSEDNQNFEKVELEVLNINEVLIKGKHHSGSRWTNLMERQ
jgi:pSer/pThr/pTyr-binding forkhead associated (FHA) protein